jgi:endonuclease YncB( thermonuclease family)
MCRLALLLLVSLPWATSAETYFGKVMSIADGDTLTVLVDHRQVKVRLAEIDAPENRQAFGQRSKQSLADLVFGQPVRVEQQDRDRHGRVVGRMYARGLDVNANAERVKRGMAWVYQKYARDQALFALERQSEAIENFLECLIN